LGVQKGKEIEALKLLDRAALNLDNTTSILSYKTALLIRQKQFQQAFYVAKQVDDSSPKLSIGKILKGDVYLAEKKYNKALQSYQLAYQITPTTKVLDGMLLILSEQNKQVDAIALLENELAKNKDNTQIQFRLAVAYQNSGRYESSIKYYEKLIDKQQGNAIVLNNLAWVYSQQKHPKALKLAKEAFIKAPKSGAVADTYGYILLTNGHSKESLKILKQAAELSPELTEIQLHLAEAHLANQQKSKAKQILQQILSKEGAEKAAAMKLMEEF
jgi:tetratricopeptide (TPR) repeat protein